MTARGEHLSLAERFADKWMPEPNSGCWLWLGHGRPDGYGTIDRKIKGFRRAMRAHRVSYEIHVGPVPDGLLVCHSCDVRSCVNPDHLFLGTYEENMADCINKGRFVYPKVQYGAGHGMAKLTEADVRAIRASKVRLVDISAEYGISVAQASNVRRRVAWKSLP